MNATHQNEKIQPTKNRKTEHMNGCTLPTEKNQQQLSCKDYSIKPICTPENVQFDQNT
jgi:hypothetical protein